MLLYRHKISNWIYCYWSRKDILIRHFSGRQQDLNPVFNDMIVHWIHWWLSKVYVEELVICLQFTPGSFNIDFNLRFCDCLSPERKIIFLLGFLGDQKFWFLLRLCPLGTRTWGSCAVGDQKFRMLLCVIVGDQKFWIFSCVLWGIRNSEYFSASL